MTDGKRVAVNPSTPISRLCICTRAITQSRAGRCAVGAIVRDDDPRVAIAPECFTPLILRVESS
jgi:hypothetical protein